MNDIHISSFTKVIFFLVILIYTVQGAAFGLDSRLTPAKKALPQKLVTHVLTVKNDTERTSTYALEVIIPEDWILISRIPNELTLKAKELRKLPLTVMVPSGAPAANYEISCKLTSLNPGTVFNNKAVIAVGEIYGVRILIPEAKKGITYLGEEFNFRFKVKNTGNTPDKFLLSVINPYNLKAEFSPDIVELSPGERKEVSLNSFVPYDFTSEEFWFRVKATSLSSFDESTEEKVVFDVLPPTSMEEETIPASVILSTDTDKEMHVSFSLGRTKDLQLNLTSKYDLEENRGETTSLFLGFERDNYRIELGELSYNLNPAINRKIVGEGVLLQLRMLPYGLDLLRTEKEGRASYGVKLVAGDDKKSLSVGYRQTNDEDKTSAINSYGVYSLKENWNLGLGYEYAWGEEDTKNWKGNAWGVETHYKGKHYSVGGSYAQFSSYPLDDSNYDKSFNAYTSIKLSDTLRLWGSLYREQRLEEIKEKRDGLGLEYNQENFPYLSLRSTSYKESDTAQTENKLELYTSHTVRNIYGSLNIAWPLENNEEADYSIHLRKYRSPSYDWMGYRSEDQVYELGIYRSGRSSISYQASYKFKTEQRISDVDLVVTRKFNQGWFVTINIEGKRLFSAEAPNFVVRLSFGQRFEIPAPFPVTTGRIYGTVFSDINLNGQLDPDEETFEGVIVQVDEQRMSTDTEGNFAMVLSPGFYHLGVDRRTLPIGSTLSEGFPRSISVKKRGITNVLIPLIKTSSLEGYVLEKADDTAGNKIAGARILLLKEGKIVEEAFSDREGRYIFPQLKPGKYTIRFDLESLPKHFELVSPKEQVINVGAANPQKINFVIHKKKPSITYTFTNGKEMEIIEIGKD